MKVCLDSNVLIAAFATHGLCNLVFEAVLAHHEFVLSHELLTEIQASLKKKLKLPDVRTKEIISFLKNHTILIEDTPVDGLFCRDPNDLKVLALAVNGGVDVLVTGDQDLLVLKKIGQISIITPRAFWERLREVSGP